jgi:hypothetical protein
LEAKQEGFKQIDMEWWWAYQAWGSPGLKPKGLEAEEMGNCFILVHRGVRELERQVGRRWKRTLKIMLSNLASRVASHNVKSLQLLLVQQRWLISWKHITISTTEKHLISLCSGPPKMVCSMVPVNGTLFGNRFFADVIKLK